MEHFQESIEREQRYYESQQKSWRAFFTEISEIRAWIGWLNSSYIDLMYYDQNDKKKHVTLAQGHERYFEFITEYEEDKDSRRIGIKLEGNRRILFGDMEMLEVRVY